MRTPRRPSWLAPARPRLAARVVLAGLVLLSAAACSLAPSWVPGGAPSVVRLSDGTAFLVAGRDDGAQMTAVVRGT